MTVHLDRDNSKGSHDWPFTQRLIGPSTIIYNNRLKASIPQYIIWLHLIQVIARANVYVNMLINICILLVLISVIRFK